MLKLLVVSGEDAKEAGVARLVEHTAQRSKKFETSFIKIGEWWSGWLEGPGPGTAEGVYRNKWDVVWFSGHLTKWRKGEYASLESRCGSAFRRFALYHEFVARTNTQLLVLSTCNSVRKEPALAQQVVAYAGTLYGDDSLVFAAAFVTKLFRETGRRRIEPGLVQTCFRRAQATVRDKRWKLYEPTQVENPA